MEYLADYFEPVAFAEYCSVVYVCRKQVPREVAPVSELPHGVRMELMDRAIARFGGYPRAVLECAKAALLIERGELGEADVVLARVETERGSHHAVRAALDLIESFR
jgi:hypothetical protein